LGVRGGCGGWCGAPGPWAGGWGCSVASGGDAAVDVPGLGDEQAGRVDQQGGVGVLVGQLPADPVGLVPVGQVGGDPPGLAVLGQGGDSVVDLGRVLRSGPPAPDQGPPAGGLPGGPQLPTGPLREPLDPHRLANLGTSSVSPRRSSGHIPPGSAPVHVQTTPVASATSAGPEADNAAPAVCSHHGEPPSASPASGNPRLPASVLSC
jgi:hypothetical protein